jgi:predicted nuclease of predicted toxin-antitoxin system
MRVLLDENLPESLVPALRQLGHQVDSVNRLRLKGLDNSTLYQQVAQDYDLCFTRDVGFVNTVRRMRSPINAKLIRVVLPQRPAGPFVNDFVEAFERTDWADYENGSDWP